MYNIILSNRATDDRLHRRYRLCASVVGAYVRVGSVYAVRDLDTDGLHTNRASFRFVVSVSRFNVDRSTCTVAQIYTRWVCVHCEVSTFNIYNVYLVRCRCKSITVIIIKTRCGISRSCVKMRPVFTDRLAAVGFYLVFSVFFSRPKVVTDSRALRSIVPIRIINIRHKSFPGILL